MVISINLSIGPEAVSSFLSCCRSQLQMQYMASLQNHLKNGKAMQHSETRGNPGGWGEGALVGKKVRYP